MTFNLLTVTLKFKTPNLVISEFPTSSINTLLFYSLFNLNYIFFLWKFHIILFWICFEWVLSDGEENNLEILEKKCTVKLNINQNNKLLTNDSKNT